MTTAAAAFAVALSVGLAALGLWARATEHSRLTRVQTWAFMQLEGARTEREDQRLSEAASTLRGLVERLKTEPNLSDLARIAESQRGDLDRQLRATARRDQNQRHIAKFTELLKPGNVPRGRTLAWRILGPERALRRSRA